VQYATGTYVAEIDGKITQSNRFSAVQVGEFVHAYYHQNLGGYSIFSKDRCCGWYLGCVVAFTEDRQQLQVEIELPYQYTRQGICFWSHLIVT
jgi:hypothetical protein